MILRLLLALVLPCVQAAGPEATVARVGKRAAITTRDLADWQALSDCYPESLSSRRAAFMRQFEAAIQEELLKREFGRALSAADLKAERERIDRDTRAPDILACIKAKLDKEGRYERVYLRPLIVQRLLYERIRADSKVQRRAERAAAEAKRLLDGGASFEAIAARLQVERSSATFSETPADGWEAGFIARNLKALTTGQVGATPSEAGDLRFVRLLEAAGGRYRFESLRIKKVTPEDFLKSVPKLSFTIADAELREWVAGIHGNPVLAALKR